MLSFLVNEFILYNFPYSATVCEEVINMLTMEEQQQQTELINSNKDFAYLLNKHNEDNMFLISQISHEIRNPLTLIKSTVQLIESEHPEAKEFKYWTQLTEDINGLDDLLTELCLYKNSEVVSITEENSLLILKSVLNSFSPLAEQNGINLSLTSSEGELAYYNNYSLDEVKFTQVFTNLIKNAFEATQKGDYINVECSVSLPSQLIISVHNNGQIIPADELPTIFKPFVTHKSGGTGLGLAISSNIIAAHNGTIEVISSEEKTSFIIHLPISE